MWNRNAKRKQHTSMGEIVIIKCDCELEVKLCEERKKSRLNKEFHEKQHYTEFVSVAAYLTVT